MLDPNGFTPIPFSGSDLNYKQAIIENRCRIADAKAPSEIGSTDLFFVYQSALFTLINLAMTASLEQWPEIEQITELERAYQDRMYDYTSTRFCQAMSA